MKVYKIGKIFIEFKVTLVRLRLLIELSAQLACASVSNRVYLRNDMFQFDVQHWGIPMKEQL